MFELPARCEHCGWENRLSAAYCGGCGRGLSLTTTCQACGADNPARQRHCNMCGVTLGVGERLAHAASSERPGPAHPKGVAAPVLAGTYSPDRGTLPWVVLAIAFWVAAAARLYELGDAPYSAESAFLTAAAAVLDGGWIGLWSESAGGQPAGMAYLLAVWSLPFGESIVAARLLSAWLGLATLGMFYLFCRSLFGSRPAALGTLLMALSVWHLSYSRLALPILPFLLVELLAAHLLFLAFANRSSPGRQRRLLVAAGLSFGSGIYVHGGFFVLVAGVLLWWCRELLVAEHPLATVLRRAATFFLPALIVATPYLVSLAANAGEVADRVGAVAVFSSPAYQERSGVTEQTRYVLGNVGGAAVTLLWRKGGDEGLQRPADRILDPVTALLAVAGLAVGLRRWRERRYTFLWALLACSLVGAALTREAGVYARLMVAAPAVFASAGLALDWVLSAMRGRAPNLHAYAAATLLVALLAAYNIGSYYRSSPGPPRLLWADVAGMAPRPSNAVGPLMLIDGSSWDLETDAGGTDGRRQIGGQGATTLSPEPGGSDG